MGRVEEPLAGRLDEDAGQSLLVVEVVERRPAAEVAVDDVSPLGPVQLVAGRDR